MAILAWHRPANPIGWLFGVGGLLQAVAASGTAGRRCRRAGRCAPTRRCGCWRRSSSTAGRGRSGCCFPLALLLFPDGRPVSPRWWPVVVGVVVTAPLFVAGAGVRARAGGGRRPGRLPHPRGLRPTSVRCGWPRSCGPWPRTWQPWRLSPCATAGAARAVRRQLLWLLVVMVVVVAANALWGLVAGTPIAVLLTIPLIPITVTVADRAVRAARHPPGGLPCAHLAVAVPRGAGRLRRGGRRPGPSSSPPSSVVRP